MAARYSHMMLDIGKYLTEWHFHFIYPSVFAIPHLYLTKSSYKPHFSLKSLTSFFTQKPYLIINKQEYIPRGEVSVDDVGHVEVPHGVCHLYGEVHEEGDGE